MTVLLASQSPQRSAILGQIGLLFRVIDVDAEEEPTEGDAEYLAVENSHRKAVAGVALAGADNFVIGADTVVRLSDTVFGKPADRDDAERMIRALSGQTHVVVGGVTVHVDDTYTAIVASTEVRFRTLTDELIAWYLDSGEWRDRAGAYAIQGRGAACVESISGDYLNVVGFPLAAFIDTFEDQLRPLLSASD